MATGTQRTKDKGHLGGGGNKQTHDLFAWCPSKPEFLPQSSAVWEDRDSYKFFSGVLNID